MVSKGRDRLFRKKESQKFKKQHNFDKVSTSTMILKSSEKEDNRHQDE